MACAVKLALPALRNITRHSRLLTLCSVNHGAAVFVTRRGPLKTVQAREGLTEQQIRMHGEASSRMVPPVTTSEEPTEWVIASLSRRLIAALIDVAIVVGAMGMSWYLRVVAGEMLSRELADSTAWYSPPDPPLKVETSGSYLAP